MLNVRTKICGITSVEAARHAVSAGADALGLVFYEKSPRVVSVEQAKRIASVVPPFVSLVGLFVNAEAKEVQKVVDVVPLQLLQFHGDEKADYCDQFSLPYIKVFRMSEDIDVSEQMSRYTGARGFLLDAYHADKPGGTGESFDWERFPKQSNKPVILAGGLTPANVSQAVKQTTPYAVDVSGGVESEPGVKDPVKVTAFIEAVKQMDSSDK